MEWTSCICACRWEALNVRHVRGDCGGRRHRGWLRLDCHHTRALFSSQNLQGSPSHRILWYMHETLNIDENKN